MRAWPIWASIAVAVIITTSLLPSSIAHSASVAAPTLGRGELDCNGDSAIQSPLKSDLMCAHPTGLNGEFTDNGWYVGHDEPGVSFYSNTPGSGNRMTFSATLPTNPLGGFHKGVQNYEDYVTWWYGLILCDNASYTRNACINDSDLNTGLGISPTDAGSAFMELQFYAPGFPPFANVSCTNGPHTTVSTQWCAALKVDSLECTFGFSFCNPSCTEPVNFAFLTTDGVPVGPPSPQDSNGATFASNQSTIFRMNPGDHVITSIHDTPAGLYVGIHDDTTGGSGHMVASVSNGFMNTNINTCNGTPYAFHPEYSTAAVPNLLSWGAFGGDVSMVTEIGHYEVYDHGDADDNFCATSPANGKLVCADTDIDYDGVAYHPGTWPVSATTTKGNGLPVNVRPLVSGMFGPESLGQGYPIFSFFTDVGLTLLSEPLSSVCNPSLPNQCSVDKLGMWLPTTYAGFYPYFSSVGCTLYFGDVHQPGADTYGGLAGYGPTIPTYGGPPSATIFAENTAYYANTC